MLNNAGGPWGGLWYFKMQGYLVKSLKWLLINYQILLPNFLLFSREWLGEFDIASKVTSALFHTPFQMLYSGLVLPVKHNWLIPWGSLQIRTCLRIAWLVKTPRQRLSSRVELDGLLTKPPLPCCGYLTAARPTSEWDQEKFLFLLSSHSPLSFTQSNPIALRQVF